MEPQASKMESQGSPKISKISKNLSPEASPNRPLKNTSKKLQFWSPPGKLDMQSAHACAVQTHFFILAYILKKNAQRHHIGSIWEAIFVKDRNFDWKNGFQNSFHKKVPRPMQIRDYSQARRPLERQPRVRAFPTRNICLSNSCYTVLNSCRNN